jgi:MbtH protein
LATHARRLAQTAVSSAEWTMTDDELDDATPHRVVVNHEEQYSIWPVDRDVPLGWTIVGVEGTKRACLDHIERVWTDMRPRSLREAMDSANAS